MYRDWLMGGLLGCDTGIDLYMVCGTRKVSYIIKNVLIIDKNLFLACSELGYHTFAVADFRVFLDTYTLIWDMVFFGW